MGNIFIEYIDTALPCFKCKQCDIVLFTRISFSLIVFPM